MLMPKIGDEAIRIVDKVFPKDAEEAMNRGRSFFEKLKDEDRFFAKYVTATAERCIGSNRFLLDETYAFLTFSQELFEEQAKIDIERN